jgi:hypothetical protein
MQLFAADLFCALLALQWILAIKTRFLASSGAISDQHCHWLNEVLQVI